jgi:hypothetical protein
MSVLNELASAKGRRDEKPNQELAARLAAGKDPKDIHVIAEAAANHPDKKIQSDCIKTLYEIGYIDPQLIARYTVMFLDLTQSHNNRLVWGAMMALALVTPLQPEVVFQNVDQLIAVIEKGSVITVDNGVKVLACLARFGGKHEKRTLPFLLKHLRNCRPKEVPQHSESISIAINTHNRDAFLGILSRRLDDLTAIQKKRVEKVIRNAKSLTG